jgi:hypothetical protein
LNSKTLALVYQLLVIHPPKMPNNRRLQHNSDQVIN